MCSELLSFSTGGAARMAWKPVPPSELLARAADLQTALNPAGPQAGRIYSLWQLFLWVCVAVYVLVMLTLVLGLFWRRRKRMADADEPPVTKPDAPGERRAWAIVSTCIVITIVVLFVLMVSE